MIDQLLDGQLSDLLRDVPQVAPAVVDQAIEEARGVAQRRPQFARLDPRAWPPQSRSIADPGIRRSARVVLVLALVALLAAAVLGVGSRLPINPPSIRAALTPAGVLTTVVHNPKLTALADGRLLVLGSASSGLQVLIFDPTTGQFSGGGITAGSAFADAPSAWGQPDGRVLLFGSLITQSGDQGPSALGWLDASTGKVSVAGQIKQDLFAPGAAILRDGRVLIAGGLYVPRDSSEAALFGAVASVEVFDPQTSAFSELAPLPRPRFLQSMLVLEDGRVLMAGGSGRSADVVEVDAYDPASGQSAVVGTTGQDRGPNAPPPARRPLLRLADGTVLIAGGPLPNEGCQNVDVPQAMFRYDPATNHFASLAPLPHVVEQAAALPDGRVLVLGVHEAVPGGCASGAQSIQVPWLGVYDPRSGVTAETSDPTTGKGGLEVQVTSAYVSGALLPDGRIALISDVPDRSVPNHIDLFELTK